MSTKSITALLGTPELAAMIGVPQRTLDQWAYQGKGPAYIKVGRHRRYRPEAVEQWLADCTVTTGGDAA